MAEKCKKKLPSPKETKAAASAVPLLLAKCPLSDRRNLKQISRIHLRVTAEKIRFCLMSRAVQRKNSRVTITFFLCTAFQQPAVL